MARITALALGLTASIMVSGIATAQSSAAMSGSAGNAGTNKDFGHLSADGISAFNDIHLARIALFHGDTNEAAKLIGDAKDSLDKAKTDNTIFMKAESDLRGGSPQGPQQPKGAPMAWIPIDGEIVLGETYRSTPDKAAAVVNANKSLEKGDPDKAMETIRLAAVDVDYVMGVAPLQQSVTDVSQADQMMASHDFYGAQEALRKAEEGIRYDEIDDIANVKGATKTANGKSK